METKNPNTNMTSDEKDRAFKAATHDVDEAKPQAPGPAGQKSESTGRKATDDWKKNKK